MARRTPVLPLLMVAGSAVLFACAEDSSAPQMVEGPGGVFNTSTPEFDILSSVNDDRSISGATDGSKYLVGFTTSGIVRSFLISGGGNLIQEASTHRLGSDPMVAFDGNNYLLVWTDQNGGPSNVFGQFINAAGNKSGNLFRITTEGSVTLSGIAFGGGQYLVTYTRSNLSGATGFYGKFVSPAGAPGNRFLISNAFGTGTLNDVATDGTDFLAVWQSGAGGEVVKARLVQGSGTLGQVATLNSTPEPSAQSLGVAFAGGNYLVTWSDSVGLHESNVYGRLVTAAGIGSGGRISISGASGQQIGANVSVLGGNFLVTWLDLNPVPAFSSLKGRFFTTAGAPTGTIHTLFNTNTTTAKLPISYGPVTHGNDALYIINRAVPGGDPQDLSDMANFDLHGAVRSITP